MLQLSKRERAMIDGFVQDDALAWFQQRIIFRLRVGLNHQIHFAAEHAALIVLIADLQSAVRGISIQLSISVLHQLIPVAFNLLAGEPCRASPDYAQCDDDTYGNIGLFHC